MGTCVTGTCGTGTCGTAISGTGAAGVEDWGAATVCIARRPTPATAASKAPHSRHESRPAVTVAPHSGQSSALVAMTPSSNVPCLAGSH